MKVLVIYCHPSHHSFTHDIKESFVKGLNDGAHEVKVVDLYEDDFQSDMTEQEYLREGFYDEKALVPDDVKYYQELINCHEALVFIYPVFWSEAPSKLVGWFQRVFTYGFAYGNQWMKVMKKALFLVTMGGDARQELRKRQIKAMQEIMVHDRMAGRAENIEFAVYDRMSRGYDERQLKYDIYLKDAYCRGKDFDFKKRG
ncbi:NAD(P)H-dependent oxidoreductase [[Clostridium] spiroforme]|nr:NAD(P)H-dependent oxidoreductase [Thomasclavelia spiroformis]MBM6880749.1 NAD(P)H-dependent oxidoreductase [Thomasclavelia spiroformis]